MRSKKKKVIKPKNATPKIKEIIEKLGGLSAIARKLNLSIGTVSHWKNTGTIPAEYARLIFDTYKRKFTLRQLRPDLWK